MTPTMRDTPRTVALASSRAALPVKSGFNPIGLITTVPFSIVASILYCHSSSLDRTAHE
jgi:hypothetical protein